MRELSSSEIDVVAGGAFAASSATGFAILGASAAHTNAAAVGGFFFGAAATSGTAIAVGLVAVTHSTSIAVS